MSELDRLIARWEALDSCDRAIESGDDPLDAIAEYEAMVAEWEVET